MASSPSLTTFSPASSMVATATTPPMTIMHSTLRVSSTVPAISTRTSPDQGTITTFTSSWGIGSNAEEGLAMWLNAYTTGDGVPWYTYPRRESEDPSLYSTCGLEWSSSFFQWASTGIDISTLTGYSCYDYAPSPSWSCFQNFTKERGSDFTCTSIAARNKLGACQYRGTNESTFVCDNTAQTPLWTCSNTATPEAVFGSAFFNAAKEFPFTASPPCCGGCTYTAGDVQVYYWPPATTSPLTILLSNSKGFTL